MSSVSVFCLWQFAEIAALQLATKGMSPLYGRKLNKIPTMTAHPPNMRDNIMAMTENPVRDVVWGLGTTLDVVFPLNKAIPPLPGAEEAPL
jgi:hypothetical protein